MNPLYTALIIGFLIGLSSAVPLLLNLRPRWKARGYALGHDAAYASQQRLLDDCNLRIKALHNDIGQLQQIRDIEKRGHQTSVDAIMQDCDERIAIYARRAGAFNEQDLTTLGAIANQLELAATTHASLRANDYARFARLMQQHTLNLAQRLRAALQAPAEQPGKPAEEQAA